MRIALLGDVGEGLPEARALAGDLRRSGLAVDVLALGGDADRRGAGAAAAALLDRALARRGFATPLAGVPLLVAQLLRARPDVVHAVSVPAAEAALAWRWIGRAGAVVFTPATPLTRERLADRRLRLRQTRRACEAVDAVTALDEAAQAALWRWMALRAPVIELGDGGGYAALYRTLV